MVISYYRHFYSTQTYQSQNFGKIQSGTFINGNKSRPYNERRRIARLKRRIANYQRSTGNQLQRPLESKRKSRRKQQIKICVSRKHVA